ncbi:hypothetical protein MRX96_006332 [Rhipicephalus microplus]
MGLTASGAFWMKRGSHKSRTLLPSWKSGVSADFYSRANTVLTYEGHTNLAHPFRGTRQRDPLSPLLFNLVLDEFFEDQPAHIALESEGQSVNLMAFADDIILTASTRAGRQCLLNTLTRSACSMSAEHTDLKERGLQANADKSRTLTMLPSGRDKKAKVNTEHIYMIGNNPITVPSHTSVWKYLGIRFDGMQATNDTVRGDLKVLLLRLSKSPRKPPKRMVAMRACLIPRQIHRLVLGSVSSKLLKNLDTMVRGTVRKWLSLPQDVTLGFYYAPVPKGGLGVMCLRTVTPALRLHRLNLLILSSHFRCAVAASKDFIKCAIRQAEGLAVFRRDIIESSAASRRFWTRILHQSYEGGPLSRCAEAKGDEQCVVLDVQVVGTRMNLSVVHQAKRRKYLIPDMLMHTTSATGARSYPTVSYITMTYRGTWASESASILLDVGLGREHIKVATIRCLQGGPAGI